MEIIETLDYLAPTTTHCVLDCGQHVLVTVPDPILPVPEGLLPIVNGVRISEFVLGPTCVFLADESGGLIDADGDPTNGLTPLLTLEPGASLGDAVLAADELLSSGERIVIPVVDTGTVVVEPTVVSPQLDEGA